MRTGAVGVAGRLQVETALGDPADEQPEQAEAEDDEEGDDAAEGAGEAEGHTERQTENRGTGTSQHLALKPWGFNGQIRLPGVAGVEVLDDDIDHGVRGRGGDAASLTSAPMSATGWP